MYTLKEDIISVLNSICYLHHIIFNDTIYFFHNKYLNKSILILYEDFFPVNLLNLIFRNNVPLK